jgi:endonuclease/exonuclease/phosphatase family metal-dependent hydrolase
VSDAITLVSLNIEGDKHLDQIIPFLKKTAPDVVCLQEVFKDDVPIFEKSLGLQGFFAPLTDIRSKPKNTQTQLSARGLHGLLFLTRIAPARLYLDYYAREAEGGETPLFPDTPPWRSNRALLGATLSKGGKEFTILTTHFTWSAKGKASSLQRRHFEAMLARLSEIEEFVLAGDFNAPRGGEIYTRLAQLYQDNLPPDVTSTLDPHLHYAGRLDLVVDGLFSTPAYRVHNVRLHAGLSDHQAITCQIESERDGF